MKHFLDSRLFPTASPEEEAKLKKTINSLLERDARDGFFPMMGRYQRILADNGQREKWPDIHDKLKTLFMCGKPVALDGPMVGIPVSIRDTDYFKDAVSIFGKDRSLVAGIEWMATIWNTTFADTGLWMGKTFEPVSHEVASRKCENDPDVMAAYDPESTRIGRNFFREPPDPNLLQGFGLPVLNEAWRLRDRPTTEKAEGFEGRLLAENIKKEEMIPYSKTGGIFLANLGQSVVPEMKGKTVYQLNYRWGNLNPPFPMTRLIDELVQIADGIYLGQLVFASRHYNLGSFDLPFIPGDQALTLGEHYLPRKKTSWWDRFFQWITGKDRTEYVDYGYQNNGFFLMMDPDFSEEIYDDDAFPQLRPRPNEAAYQVQGLDVAAASVSSAIGAAEMDWKDGWQGHAQLSDKFTHLIFEGLSASDDEKEAGSELRTGESVLQMLKRISEDISAQSKKEDHLRYFDKLHRLFRAGLAPGVQNGLFQGSGKHGYNTRAESTKTNQWYGEAEVTSGFDYYHGATLNLHLGFNETLMEGLKAAIHESVLFPGGLAEMLQQNIKPGPNVMNMVWQSIGRYIFPWAGKSFEKISGRKLSMLLDESDDLDARYPERVDTLKHFIASAPHYDLVQKNKAHFWGKAGRYAAHLKSGSWDSGMSDVDKSFWQDEAERHWVMGHNIQDKRVLMMDALMKLADMNYREPDPSLQTISAQGPTPFVRQGYIFLGVSDQESILPMNHTGDKKKRVFQFQYRFPMIGGPAPIGYCLDELVEIADGLYLGQLIYATALDVPFHSAVSPDTYKYQLFGYFLLMDDDWQRHRLAINFDTWDKKKKGFEFSFHSILSGVK